MLVIREPELRAIVPMTDAIDAVADAFASVSSGAADQPARIGTSDGAALAMLATRRSTDGERGGTVCKVVGVSAANRRLGIPSVNAFVLWLAPETAAPSMILDGTALTALRTGAASGLATRLLASPDARTLAMIGAGGQAADQIRAVCAVRPIEIVRIASRSGASAERLAGQLAGELPGIAFEPCGSGDDAVRGADVVSCATDAVSPVFDASSVEGRVHVNAVGSYRPEMRELPTELLRRAELVVVDEVGAALAEAGELIAAVDGDPGFAETLLELGELVARPPAAPRGVTVFKSVGIAMQDWAVCKLVETRVRDGGLPGGVEPVELDLVGAPG